MNAEDLVFLNHRFNSLAYLKRFMGGKKAYVLGVAFIFWAYA